MVDERGDGETPSRLTAPRVAFDGTGAVVDVNRAARSILETAEGELVGSSVESVFGGDDADDVRRALDGDPGELPASVAVDTGDDLVEFYLFPGEDGFVALGQERDERALLRDELRRKYEILEALPIPVYQLDRNGFSEYMNPAYADLLETEREDTIGLSAGHVLRPEDLERSTDLLREMLSENPTTGTSRTFEQVSYSASGRRIQCENHIALLMDGDEFVGPVGAALDVGDRRRERKRIEVLERVLRHNLRTQLGIVQGHVDSLEAEVDGGTERVDAISESIDAMLEFSRKVRRIGGAVIDADERTSISLDQYVADSVDRLSAEYPEVRFEVDTAGSTRVVAGHAIEIAVEEVIENAAVHNTTDDPWVRVEAISRSPEVTSRHDDHPDLVGIQVADDGPGIPEQERAVVTGEGDVSPLEHSEGIGLWSAAWVVEGYGGEIRIDRREPTGTVVEILLPDGE